MTALPHPAPGEPDPLSEQQRKILSAIEAELTETAPELERLSDTFDAGSGSGPGLDRLLQIVAVAVIVVAIVPDSWLPALLVFAVMTGLPLVAALAGHHGTRDRHVDTEPEE